MAPRAYLEPMEPQGGGVLTVVPTAEPGRGSPIQTQPDTAASKHAGQKTGGGPATPNQTEAGDGEAFQLYYDI
jgi:hypothetical protein